MRTRIRQTRDVECPMSKGHYVSAELHPDSSIAWSILPQGSRTLIDTSAAVRDYNAKDVFLLITARHNVAHANAYFDRAARSNATINVEPSIIRSNNRILRPLASARETANQPRESRTARNYARLHARALQRGPLRRRALNEDEVRQFRGSR